MGKASSSKKVARAARAGQSSGSSEQRDIGFPLLMGVVIVLGLLLVTYSRSVRDVSAEAPTLQDHWHAAYGIYDCRTEGFLPPLSSDYDPRGIHSHQDGLIHIHPFSSAVTGDGANLQVFFDAMLVDLDDDDTKMVLPSGDEFSNGDDCGGEEAVLQVARFNADSLAAGAIEIVTADIGDFTFEANREAYTVAFAPIGADIPPPPADRLAALDGASPTRGTPNTIVPNSLPGLPDATTDDADSGDDAEPTEESDDE